MFYKLYCLHKIKWQNLRNFSSRLSCLLAYTGLNPLNWLNPGLYVLHGRGGRSERLGSPRWFWICINPLSGGNCLPRFSSFCRTVALHWKHLGFSLRFSLDWKSLLLFETLSLEKTPLNGTFDKAFAVVSCRTTNGQWKRTSEEGNSVSNNIPVSAYTGCFGELFFRLVVYT